MWAAPVQAQDDAHTAEIRAAIAREGQAAIIVEMDVPESAADTPEEAGLAQSAREPNTPARMRERIQRNRTAIAGRAVRLRAAMAQSSIAIGQEYENLPMLTARVNADKLERLLRMPGVKRVYLDKPVARRHATLPAAVLEKVAVSKDSVGDGAPALTGPSAATEKAQRASETAAAVESPEKAQLANTVKYIGVDKAWARGFTGQNQSIAIIDDGIDRNHDMFAGKIVAEGCFSTKVRTDDVALCPNGATSSTAVGAASNCAAGAAAAACTHGSHVAGIAAGNDTAGSFTLRGVAYGANLIPIQVFTLSNNSTDCDGDTPCLLSYASAVLNGLNYAISQAVTHRLAAVNISLGGSAVSGACDSDIRKPAIDTLRTLGVLTTISAGNDAKVGQVSPPGCISTAITTSSVIITVPDQGVNHSALVDVLAPGVAVQSANINNGYTLRSGTSMAAPHAAGAIAILKSSKTTATAAEIEAALKTGGISTTLSAWSWSTPRIDVNRSLDLMNQTPLTGIAVPGVFGSQNPGGTSFLRFFNTDATAANVTVQIYDDQTGGRVGTWTRQVRGFASP
ncbi:MAG: S8 family serine peptidase, partial [Rhodospirillaceae bacterium]|nr:S8 family serine peptidase [Rhodospirillaceae bacterium]